MTRTPFPAARPSAFTTYGACGRPGQPAAASAVSHESDTAVRTPAAAITSLAKVFEPSICAACFDGPKTGIPAARTASETPATSGASGPMTTRSKSCGQRRDGGRVVLVDRKQLGDLGDAGVARRAHEPGDGGVTGQAEDEGVLAGTGADDEDLHASEATDLVHDRCVETAVVLLVPEAEPLLDDVRAQTGAPAPGMPAHVTLLYPFTAEPDAGVLAELAFFFSGDRRLPVDLRIGRGVP